MCHATASGAEAKALSNTKTKCKGDASMSERLIGAFTVDNQRFAVTAFTGADTVLIKLGETEISIGSTDAHTLSWLIHKAVQTIDAYHGPR